MEKANKEYGNIARYTALIIGAISGCFFSMHEDFSLPWHFETALSMTVWLAVGIIIKEHSVRLSTFMPSFNKIFKNTLPILEIMIGVV